MFANTFSILLLAAAAPAALAKIFITQPVASTVWPVGQPVTMNWQDDGTAPLLPAIGVSSLGIYAGNQLQQTLLQQIGTLDVSKNNSITFQINGDIGPNNVHALFMRFTSQVLQDPTNPTFPEQAFSAMFAVSGSTATAFSPDVQAEINGASTAGAIGGGAPTPAPGAPAAATSTVVVKVTAASNTASAAKASGSTHAAGANANNAACTTLSAPAIFVAAAAFAAFFL